MSLFRRKKKYSTDTMDNGAKLITAANPKNPVSEQFRTIRTNIHFMSVDKPLRRIAFTSSSISEGKSTVTANMAITWAQDGKKVLLIDADLRRSTLHRTFELPNNRGLTTILTSGLSKIDLNEVIPNSGIKNLDVLTAGPIPPNPSELLNSKRMLNFLRAVEPMYDLVVIDVPPLLEVTDTQVLSDKLDGIVLVVRAGVTQKAGVARAVEMLKISKARLLGYVLNDADSEDAAYGYGYGYGYGDEE
ncbi:CpsD/CapB family tyrosine-protein kinase [Ligilactobacillus saerimneri]|uniref:CpsD/CapB family tyrosine-protein kinase n=1 Tax=Ligilactobacillus saerimneri TaxID=228229 RepID=UPI0022A6C303|nr:CpsD/CapB family tyrosine-protein kinase [Ligilactobacillus saerimneri]MCZ0891361.1 CpsD/CapB family tyrosine-protein kinase [Ligilactobacillus saerimneri]